MKRNHLSIAVLSSFASWHALTIFFICWVAGAAAQTDGFVQIASIKISGNKKTRAAVIHRELDFAVGDTIHIVNLQQRLQINQQNVLNTSLFVSAEVTISDWTPSNKQAHVYIDVLENWYIYPYPIFDLADRNFNVWWSEQGRSLSRVNLGVTVKHNNLTGRRDKFKITVQGGYSQKYELDYSLPGINQKQTIGIFGNFFYSQRKEIAYITEENKLLFYDFNDNYQLQRFRLSGGVSIRPEIYQYHTFKAQWSDNSIGENVAGTLNPDYFLNGRQRQRHLTLEYQYTIDKRDVRPYPYSGFLGSVLVRKDGLGLTNDVDALLLSLKWAQYFPFGKKEQFSAELWAKGEGQLIRKKQPYTHVVSMGYGENTLRGYELYVIDGMDVFLFKTALRYELFKGGFYLGNLMPIESYRTLPLRVYPVVYSDVGYLHSRHYQPYGNLHNQWLWGSGVGLDIIFYYDVVFRIQYSFNHLGEKGLFLHFNFSG